MRLLTKAIRYALLAAVLSAPWHASSGAVELPQMGDTSGAIISPEEEHRLGEAFMREVRRSLKIVEDPELEDYVQSLGASVSSHADSYLNEFTFFLVDNAAINAFAAPGGYIGLHTGLILSTETESELASVVAHEVAHITQRHLPRAIEEANKMNVPATAALIAAIILGQSNAQLGEAALATTLAGHAQAQINFTRSHEQEADRIGIELLADAGFDPRGMPQFFERLQQSYRFYDNNLPEFLSTHPVTVSRIADSRSRADQYPVAAGNPYSPYTLMQAKTRVLSHSTSADTLEFFKAGLDRGSDEQRAVARYGYGLALLQAKRLAEARQQLAPLVANDPERIPYQLAMASLESAEKKYDAALRRLEDMLLLYPGHNALTLQFADALIKNGAATRARNVLVEHLRKRRHIQPSAYKLLARAASDAGRPGESHYALAEYYYATGETSTAVQQLKLAQENTEKSDFYLSARIEARLRELQSELPTARTGKSK